MPAGGKTSHEHRRALLVNPNQMKPPVAPIALDYLAHALRLNGFNTDVIDLCFATDIPCEIEGYLSRNEVVAIAVTLRNADDTFFITQDFCIDRYKNIVDILKDKTTAPIILGGSGFSIMPGAILDYYGLNLGIWGEGEYSLPLLVERISANADYTDVPGLVYRTRDGFQTNPARYMYLNHATAPERSAIDNYRYFIEGGMGGVETKRGCPGQCIYCVDPTGKGKAVRLRSPHSVADEIESLLEIGIDHLHFCDSEFNIPVQHAQDVCRELASRRLGDKVRWYTYASPAGFTRELAYLMRRAGCAGINFGVDSGCNQILKRLGRDFSVEDIVQTADACRKENIVFMYDLLLGGPGETRQTLEETIEIMKRLSPDRVGASLGIRVFPGTPLAAMLNREGPLADNLNLHGSVSGNEGFFAPVYYISSSLNPDPSGYLARLIAGDERFFFFGDEAGADKNYNYNDNTVLTDAIKEGHRGAFWDILRRIGRS